MEYNEYLVKKLINNNFTIGALESCTGGAFISEITDVSGSSLITDGGYITYSNYQKAKIGVSKDVLNVHGPYSEACALEMARVAKDLQNSTIGVGISGQIDDGKYVTFVAVHSEYFYKVEVIRGKCESRKKAKEQIVAHVMKMVDENIGQIKSLMDGCGIIVEKGEKILFIKRRDNGEWGFPGGSFTGDPVEGAKRELFEETGLVTNNLQLLHESSNGKSLDFLYLCNDSKGEVILQEEEVLDFMWLTILEIETGPFHIFPPSFDSLKIYKKYKGETK